MRHFKWEERISGLIDNELSLPEAQGVKTHMEGCAECRRFHDDLLSINESFERLKPIDSAFTRQISFETTPYYKFEPAAAFRPKLKLAYALLAIFIMLLGGVLLQRTFIPSAGIEYAALSPIEKYLDAGTLTVDTSVSGTPVVVITPWAKIIPRGTIFTVTQEPAFLEVTVASGEVLIINKLRQNERIDLFEKERFYMDKTGKYSIEPLTRAPEAKEKHSFAIERWREK